jgi:hypothetical protein
MNIEYFVTPEQKNLLELGDRVIQIVKSYFPYGPENISSAIIKSNANSVFHMNLTRNGNLGNRIPDGNSHLRYEAYRAIYAMGGNCQEHACVTAIFLREHVVPINKYKIAVVFNKDIDHVFAAIILDLNRNYLDGDDIVVDTWAPKAKAMLFKHHKHFGSTLENQNYLVCCFSSADGKHHSTTRQTQYPSVETKYTDKYGLSPLTAQRRELLLAEAKKKVLIEMKLREETTNEELAELYIQKGEMGGIHNIKRMSTDEIKYSYISSDIICPELLAKINNICKRIMAWTETWISPVSLISINDPGLSSDYLSAVLYDLEIGQNIIKVISLIDKRKSTLDYIIHQCQPFMHIAGYSECIITACLLSIPIINTKLLALITKAEHTKLSIIGKNISPMTQLRTYYQELLTQENPLVLKNELVSMTADVLFSPPSMPISTVTNDGLNGWF